MDRKERRGQLLAAVRRGGNHCSYPTTTNRLLVKHPPGYIRIAYSRRDTIQHTRARTKQTKNTLRRSSTRVATRPHSPNSPTGETAPPDKHLLALPWPPPPLLRCPGPFPEAPLLAVSTLKSSSSLTYSSWTETAVPERVYARSDYATKVSFWICQNKHQRCLFFEIRFFLFL